MKRAAGRIQRSEFAEFFKIGVPNISPKRNIDKLPPPGHIDKPAGFQFFQMMREGSRGNRKFIMKFSARLAIASSDFLQNLKPPRIGKNPRNNLHIAALHGYFPQHFLNFFPLPHGQGSFLPIFDDAATTGASSASALLATGSWLLATS